MSVSRHSKKKPYDPPRVPIGESGGLAWQGDAGHVRSQSLPRGVSGPTPPQGTHPRASSAYPTPGPSAGRPSVGNISAAHGGTPLPAPDFQSALQPQEIDNPSSSESENGSGSESESASDSESKDSSSDESTSNSSSDSDDSSDSGEDSSSEDEKEDVKQKNQKKNKSAAKVKKEGSATPSLAESKITSIGSLTTAERSVAMTHTRSSALSLFGGKSKIQDLAKVEPRYKPNGEPEWVSETGIVSIHPDRSFDENIRGWGHLFDDISTDVSRMSPVQRPFLSRLDPSVFRSCLNAGFFTTLKGEWEATRAGTGEARLRKRRSVSRKSGRKTTKSSNRGRALKESGLDVKAYKFLVDVGYQSSDVSQATSSDDGSKGKKVDKPKKKRVKYVKYPKHRSAKATKFLGALDVKFESMKKRTGNVQFEVVKYVETNSPVPKLKGKDVDGRDLKVSKWAVDDEWLNKNPQLEIESRRFIDSSKAVEPQDDNFKQFLHTYQPEEREYVNYPPNQALEPSPISPVQSSLTVQPSVPTPSDAPVLRRPTPTVTPAPAELSVPAPGHQPTLGLNNSHLAAYNTQPGFGLENFEVDYNDFSGFELGSGPGGYDQQDGQSSYPQQDFGDMPQYVQGAYGPPNPPNNPSDLYLNQRQSYPTARGGGDEVLGVDVGSAMEDEAPQKKAKKTKAKVKEGEKGKGKKEKKEKEKKDEEKKEKKEKKKAKEGGKGGKEKATKSSDRKSSSKSKSKSKDPEPSNPPVSRKRKSNGREVEDEEPVAGSSKPRVKPGDVKKAKLTGLFSY